MKHMKTVPKHIRKSSYHTWTQDDDDTLRNLNSKHASQDEYELAFPSVVSSAIYARRRRLGLISSKNRWSLQEDEAIRKFYPEHSSSWSGWSRHIPNRTPVAIDIRAKMLGFTKQSRAHCKWTAQEDKFIKANYTLHTSSWDGWSKLYGRSWASIQQRASHLHVRRSRMRFNENERIEIARSVADAAQRLECSSMDIAYEIAYLMRMKLMHSYLLKSGVDADDL